jgi:hypothetical protein
MKAAGMDTVVIQFSAHNGTDLAPAVDRVMAAAERLGMTVWLGTPLDETRWWKQSWSPAFLQAITAQVAHDTYEAVKRVAAHPALVGVYLPYETNGLSNPWAMGNFLGALSAAARRARPDLPVMISPFTNLTPGKLGSLPAKVLTRWWDTVLARATIDVLAWQDGVGACTPQLGQVDQDLGAIAQATQKHGVQLWADLEAFQRTTPLTEAFAATAAPFERFQQQLEKVAPWVDRVIAFDFNHYMDPAVGDDQRRLYEAYQAWRQGT